MPILWVSMCYQFVVVTRVTQIDRFPEGTFYQSINQNHVFVLKGQFVEASKIVQLASNTIQEHLKST